MPIVIKRFSSSLTFIYYVGCFLIVQILTIWIAYDINIIHSIRLDTKDRRCVLCADWISTQAQYFTSPTDVEFNELLRRILIQYTETFEPTNDIYVQLIDEKGIPVSSFPNSPFDGASTELIDLAFFAGTRIDRFTPLLKTIIHSRPIAGSKYTFIIGVLPGNLTTIPISLIIASVVCQVLMISTTALAIRRKTLIDAQQNRIVFLEDENHRLSKKNKHTSHNSISGAHRSEHANHPPSSVISDIEFDDITDTKTYRSDA